MHKFFLVGSALALSLTGCDVYFGPSSTSDCGLFEPCGTDIAPDVPPPGTPGGECLSDYECAAGCFCERPENASLDDPGACVETGFCDSDSDCPADFACQLDRATCVPDLQEPPPPVNCLETGCLDGEMCDLASGQCVPQEGCLAGGDCGPGFECGPNGLCVPVNCTADDQCLGGCACDVDTGVCEETGFCLEDADCPDWCDAATGDCTPMECDAARGTCTWGESTPSGSCNGDLTCGQPAPQCPTGETAEVLDGCYTGECLLIEDCSSEPLARCERIQNVNQCIARSDCELETTGYDCACGSDGIPCDCANPPLDENDQPMECTCSTWETTCESV